MQTKKWNTKKEILETYPISSATYKKRIKDIDPTKTKFIPSKTGSPTRLIHHSILDELFRKRRRLSTKEYKQTIKWVRNHYWTFIGNIVPVSSSIDDLKNKMRFLFDELKTLQMEKNQITLYYAIEKNPNGKAAKIPLHLATNNNAPLNIIKALLTAYPRATEIKDKKRSQMAPF